MTLRPMNPAGDILPVSSASEMCTGPEAVGWLAYLLMKIFRGDWWEDFEEGCEILELLQRNRISSGNLSLLSSAISAYLGKTPGVLDVQDAEITLNGHQATYSCRLITSEETIPFSTELYL